MIKLIVSDVDGTLVPTGGRTPSAELTAALNDCVKSGTIAALASGRPLSGLMDLFPDLRDQLVYICCNGTAVVWHGQMISASSLASGEELKKLIDLFRELHCDFMVSTAESALAEESMSDTARHMIAGSGIKLEIVRDVLAAELPVLQMTAVCSSGLETLMNHPRIKELSGQYTVVRTGECSFDITNRAVDKGTAVAVLQSRLEIQPEETIVFGDSMNDVPMFSKTPNSYAVENAPDIVKSFASRLVEGPDANGIARLLRKSIHCV